MLVRCETEATKWLQSIPFDKGRPSELVSGFGLRLARTGYLSAGRRAADRVANCDGGGVTQASTLRRALASAINAAAINAAAINSSEDGFAGWALWR